MTPEQKQRIERIGRLTQMRRETRATALAPEILDDIDFLLSLVKSQEATPSKSVVRRLAQQGAICRECLYSPTLDLVRLCQRHAAIDDAATEMRSACVEKLRSSLYDPSLRFSDEGIKAAITDWTNILIRRLESLSIEKPKE